MDGPSLLLVESIASLAAVAMLSLAGLRAWHGWLALRRDAIAAGPHAPGGSPSLAGLRARVKRLEAIASGLDG